MAFPCFMAFQSHLKHVNRELTHTHPTQNHTFLEETSLAVHHPHCELTHNRYSPILLSEEISLTTHRKSRHTYILPMCCTKKKKRKKKRAKPTRTQGVEAELLQLNTDEYFYPTFFLILLQLHKQHHRGDGDLFQHF